MNACNIPFKTFTITYHKLCREYCYDIRKIPWLTRPVLPYLLQELSALPSIPQFEEHSDHISQTEYSQNIDCHITFLYFIRFLVDPLR